MRASIQNWWDMREPRERILLAILAALGSVFALIFLLLLPAQAARAESQTALDRAQQELTLVARIAPAFNAGAPTVRAPFDRSVLIRTAQAHGIKLTRVQPAGDGSIAAWIDEAQTDDLYALFEDLLGGYAVTLDRAVVSADANGRLSAQFTVR